MGPPMHYERPGAVFDALSPFVGEQRISRLTTVAGQRTRHLTALLDSVHDRHNVSACVRSCDAFGINDLHIVPQAGVPLRFSPMTARGALRWVRLHVYRTIDEALDRLDELGYHIVATDLGGPQTPPTELAHLDVSRPLCVAFGNEHAGISDTLRARCDERMQIPMHGFVESFNVSVAFALATGQLRERLNHHRGGNQGDLTPNQTRRLLDRWIFRDVPQAANVLAELSRRAAID